MPHVLVVDDDRAIRELLRFALECEGYDVTTLNDGADVVETLAARSEPCVVLMDLMMPHTDGWTVCAALAHADAILARHALVVMTASFLEGDTFPAPARALLRKPFELDRVFALVASLTLALNASTLVVDAGAGLACEVAPGLAS